MTANHMVWDEMSPKPTHTCPHCQRSSPHPDDVKNRYCIFCHHYCDDIPTSALPSGERDAPPDR